MSHCLVIFGMHRSGTSCLSRILNRAGLELGRELINGANHGNLLGHWESARAVELNDRLLKASGGSWDQPPERVIAEESCLKEMRHWVSQFDGVPVWGWKDPRTMLTFSAWRPLLPKTSIVACLRNPLAVARSLSVRNGFPLERGLQLWQAYNQRLLELTRSDLPIFWYVHGETPEKSAQRLRSLCRHTGLNYSDELLELINPHLDHHGRDREGVDPQTVDLYSQLLKMADSQLVEMTESTARTSNSVAATAREGSCPSDQARVPCQEPIIDGGLGLNVRQLSEVIKQSDALLQQSFRTALQLEGRCSSGEALITSLQKHQAALQHQIAACHRQLDLSHLRNAEVVAQWEQDTACWERRTAQLEGEVNALRSELMGFRTFVETLRHSFPFRLRRKLSGLMQAMASQFRLSLKALSQFSGARRQSQSDAA